MLESLRQSIRAWLVPSRERGASAVEYALLIAGIAGIIVLVVYAFGGVIGDIFATTCNSVGTHAGSSSSC